MSENSDPSARMGVILTEQEQAEIRTLLDEGKKLDAQGIVLSAVEALREADEEVMP